MFDGRWDNYWEEKATLPLVSGQIAPPSLEGTSLHPSLDIGNFQTSLEPWEGSDLYWPVGTESFASPHQARDWLPINDYHLAQGSTDCITSEKTYTQEDTSYSPTLIGELWLETRKDSEVTLNMPVECQQMSYYGPEHCFVSNNAPEVNWASHPGGAGIEDTPTLSFDHGAPNSQKDTRKALFKLRMELVEDLDLFGGSCSVFAASSDPPDHVASSTDRLTNSINRLLDSSTSLLDIIRILQATGPRVGKTSDLTPSTQPQHFQNCPSEGSLMYHSDAGENGYDESVTTTPSNDSGYQTASGSPPHSTTSPSIDVTLWLGVLEAHCYLVRIYRGVFTYLYQLLLLARSADAVDISLLPNLEYSHAEVDENLRANVKVLVELGSTMIEIEVALELLFNCNRIENGRESNTLGKGNGIDWLSIREFVSMREQDPFEMSLREMMKWLRQLVGDTTISSYREVPLIN